MNVKNIVLGIGIFVVYMMMLTYGIEAFYASPKYEDFCTEGYRYGQRIAGQSALSCPRSQVVQEAEQACYKSKGFPEYKYNETGCAVAVERCNYCQKDFDEARLAYEKKVFVIAIIAGVLTLFIGYGILSVEPIGSALMASGVGAIVYGSARNWENLSNVWRFLLLLAALILLIWIAWRLNRKNIQPSHLSLAGLGS